MHPDFNSNMKSNFNTDERTNERYEDGPPAESTVTVCNARARIDEMTAMSVRELLAEADPTGPVSADVVRELSRLLRERESRNEPEKQGRTFGQIVDDLLESRSLEHGKRWPVIRTGEREPIPWVLRASILSRDDNTCKVCGWHDTEFELDHRIPWSAGGPDDSENLRTLCKRCNQDRSNFIDHAHTSVVLPTTYWCIDCWTYDNHQARRMWKDGTDLNDAPWVAQEGVEKPMVLAYCAHCHYISQTDVYFAGELGRNLIARATRFVKQVTA